MTTPVLLSRRALLAGLPLALAGCSTHRFEPPPETLARRRPLVHPDLAALYDELPNERFPVPAVDLDEVDPEVLRRMERYSTPEQPGTLVIDTREHALFLVMEGGRALRYGVGVGKEGLAWSGRAVVGRKAEWPRWTPTREMIAREPERNGRWAGGMAAGLDNPLGARALYLYRNGRDTMYRIHGTNEPWSIGQSVSSGCIRMINQDVIDLYRRTPEGTPVVVLL